ncbi:YtxH domain-containing protein [Zafaria sp. Z1313]|uniref:YtxH domain-containing protein n=1 Tax=unclassified Zafaria TaxID=2828765 RepID=UPI002E76833F|nr:YtxH domain-containing protein [Zafaria sp. J156]MEE1619977.1 YtxH domain-containing protein [Zafaria sp. J156]
MRILTFLAGAAAGYILGTRSGRESYEKMKAKALELWEDPRTQEKIGEVGSVIKEKAPEVGAAVGAAASTVASKVKETAAQATGSAAPEHAPDHVSDPARDDSVGSDWAAEGGATPSGPATGH